MEPEPWVATEKEAAARGGGGGEGGEYFTHFGRKPDGGSRTAEADSEAFRRSVGDSLPPLREVGPIWLASENWERAAGRSPCCSRLCPCTHAMR